MTRPVIAVFGASRPRPGDPVYAEGVRCGRLLAAAGFTVATGGYLGLMEAVSRGAHEAGGEVLGITAPTVFPDRTGANEFVTDERPAACLPERLHAITDLSAASITLPGSLGTLTELLLVWNLAYVARFHGGTIKPVLAVGAAWAELVDRLAADLETDRSLVVTVSTVDDAVATLVERLR